MKEIKEQFFEALAEIEREKGIKRESLVAAIEDALHSAYRKNFGVSKQIKVQIEQETGKVSFFAIKKVVEKVTNPHNQISLEEARKLDKEINIGGTIKEELSPREFGRIATQIAKQVIIQRIREAEREMIYKEFKDRVNTIVTGVVSRERGNSVYIDLGKAEGILPHREQCPREEYKTGDRIKVYILSVKQGTRGPQIILSRTYRELVRKLFEMEVPEIYEGLVEIKAVAREPGVRSKIAVSSKEEKIDGVGACVGMGGIRVQAIVNELNGEKIDIVQYDSNPEIFIRNALSPAQVKEAKIDEEAKVATIIVPDNQLSLAIGKGGQNVRLAARLTGWRIDIKSESQFRKEQKALKTIPLTNLPGIGPAIAERLSEHGITSIVEIANLTPKDLEVIPGIGEKMARRIWEEANRLCQSQPTPKDKENQDEGL